MRSIKVKLNSTAFLYAFAFNDKIRDMLAIYRRSSCLYQRPELRFLADKFTRLTSCENFSTNNQDVNLRSELDNNATLQGGYLYTKGAGVFGALGHGDSLQDIASFKKVAVNAAAINIDQSITDENSLSDPNTKSLRFKQISCGWGHTAVVSTDGRLFLCGRPYDFSNLMQLNRLRSISPSLGRFVGRFTSWFGSPESDAGLYPTPVGKSRG